MPKESNKIIKNYIKEIKLYFPLYGKNEHRFLKDLQNAIEDYFQTIDSPSMKALIENFGEPKHIAINYIHEQDSDVLRATLIKNTYIKRSIAIIILLTIITFNLKFFFLYIEHLQVKDAYIHREIITIEEESMEDSLSEDKNLLNDSIEEDYTNK